MSKLFHSENLLNLSAFRKIPRGTHKEFFIRFEGQAQAGKMVTLADCGTVRVNIGGTDRHNLSFSLLSSLNNLKRGVAEASSVTGGAFAFSAALPFHLWEDNTNGEYFDLDEGYIQLNFPNMTSTLIVSGTVTISTLEAPAVTSYTMSLIQRNIQVGGAGQAAIELEFRDINSLYLRENAVISNVLVVTDSEEKANNSQATLKAESNNVNRVETAIDVYEIDLNPYQEIRSGLNKETRIVLNTTGSANIDLVAELIRSSSDKVRKSLNYRSEKVPAVAEDVAA